MKQHNKKQKERPEVSPSSTSQKKQEQKQKQGKSIKPPEQKNKKSIDALSSFLLKWAPELTERTVPENLHIVSSRHSKRHPLILRILRVLPYLCVLGFGFSLFWDFSGQFELVWRSQAIELDGIIRKITVTGLVGFLTNWIAIKMLFYPRRKRPLLGQGLIPARKDRIILRLSEKISNEIINVDLIMERILESGIVKDHRRRLSQNLRDVISKKDFRDDLFCLLQYYVDQLLHSEAFPKKIYELVDHINFEKMGKIEGSLYKLYTFVSGKKLSETVEQLIKDMHIDSHQYEKYLGSYLDQLPENIEKEGGLIDEKNILKLVVYLVEQMNIQGVILENLKRFDEVRLERLLWGTTSDQLLYIQYMGCFLGVLGGLFVLMPYEAIISFCVLGGIIWLVDSLILKFRKPPAT